MVIPGIIFVLACVLTGYTMSGGNIAAILHPAEYITILGASFGTIIIASPMKIFKMVIKTFLGSFKGHKIGKPAYLELLAVLY